MKSGTIQTEMSGTIRPKYSITGYFWGPKSSSKDFLKAVEKEVSIDHTKLAFGLAESIIRKLQFGSVIPESRFGMPRRAS